MRIAWINNISFLQKDPQQNQLAKDQMQQTTPLCIKFKLVRSRNWRVIKTFSWRSMIVRTSRRARQSQYWISYLATSTAWCTSKNFPLHWGTLDLGSSTSKSVPQALFFPVPPSSPNTATTRNPPLTPWNSRHPQQYKLWENYISSGVA